MPAPSPLLPSNPAISAIEVKSRTRTRMSRALSGKRAGVSYGGQWYEAALKFPPMRKDQFGPIIAFLESLGGKETPFYIALTPDTGVTGEIVGNLVNFDNDTKLHRVTETDPATVVYPPARVGGGAIVTDPVYLYCRRKGDVQAMSIGKDGLVRFELDVEEEL